MAWWRRRWVEMMPSSSSSSSSSLSSGVSSLVLMSMTIILTSFPPFVTSQSMKVTLGPLMEERRTGTYVGSIASVTSIGREVTQAEFKYLKFEFLDPNNAETHLFSINRRSGALSSHTMIDRETVCEGMDECIISFDVTVTSDVTDFFRLVVVNINITDINDNMPTFKPSEITLDIPENNAVGLTKPLPTAMDRDTGQNSVQHYTLLEPSGPFSLDVERRLNNRFRLSLVADASLDRELQGHYTLLVVAEDGGAPSLTGTMTVHVNVTDENDNSPVFTQEEYSYSVGETERVGEVVGKLTATDVDLGKNADVRYSLIFSTKDQRGGELFAVEQLTGEITIKAPLEYDAGSTFSAVVEARDRGDIARLTEARLSLSIVNVGNNAPRLSITLQKTVRANTVRISEGARNKTFVGKLTATDNDPGDSGKVQCHSAHPNFQTNRIGPHEFTIIMNGTLDRERQDTIDVTLVCSDAGAPRKTSSSSFRVVVTDVNDNPPRFSQETYVVNVTEENIVGKHILKLRAEDPDYGVNKEFSYSLFPKENDVFGIDSKDGILTARTTFDHELERKVNVIVTATDRGTPSLVSTATVVVNILDINDNYPELTTTELRVPEEGGKMMLVGTLEGTDKDSGRNARLIFSMPPTSDITGQMFKVDPDGRVFAIQNLDRESRSFYSLSIELRDDGVEPKVVYGTVNVIVEDVNDHAPSFHFPTPKNKTVSFVWSLPTYVPITRLNATDGDAGENQTISYYIFSGDKTDLFRLEKDTGNLFLRRKVKATDDQLQTLMVAAHDWGVDQQESQTFIDLVIDITNATFAAHEEEKWDDKYVIIGGVVGGFTFIFSVTIIIIIVFLILRGLKRRNNSPPPAKNMEWQVVKSGVQEECGKQEVSKVANWRGSDVDIDMKESQEGAYSPDSQPDVTRTGGDNTFKKTLAQNSQWGDGVLQGQTTVSIGLDPYRKQDFYTFCKVRSPHGDVNSVTSGETTTSDSGRGGSEDDIPLPPIAECSPENNSNHSSPKHVIEYRPIATLPSSGNSRTPIKSEFQTMPSLTSFRSPGTKLFPSSLQSETSLSNTYPYNGDKVHPSSRPNHAYTSLTPTSKTIGRPRHVTFSNPARSGGREEGPNEPSNPRTPHPPGYEHLFPDVGGLYASLPRSVDDDDGNTTTSGSYTIDSDNLNDSIISA
ncbi:cadherin-related protein [Aplysia californica]|uniref:Cadherin-related protein n=1 Tax=Aplysia californica TaxID=6500 RepID=Q86N71_APLCA|nr:cadherin-related protein [Aplysia californica]AAO84370.1 cadherin-related protein [Aplysia californica]